MNTTTLPPTRPGGGPVPSPRAAASQERLPGSALPGAPEAVAALRATVPGFAPARILTAPRGLMLLGEAGRMPALARVYDGTAEAAAEVAALRLLRRLDAPFPYPRLLAAPAGARLLVTDRGGTERPLHPSRHLPCPMRPDHLTAVLRALRLVASWRPAAGAFAGHAGHQARAVALHRRGLLTDRDHQDVRRLLLAMGPRAASFSHGAPLPPSLLVCGGDPRAVRFPVGPLDPPVMPVDWADAGWRLPGHDLAALWLALGEDTAGRQLVSRQAQLAGPVARNGFLVSLLLGVSEELRALDGEEPDEGARMLARRLQEDARTVRRAVRTAVGTG